MEKLDDLALEEAAGGAAKKGPVTVTVSIQWSGKALANRNKVSSLTVYLTDPDGTARAVLSASNGWKAKFLVARGVEFNCDLNCKAYPFITSATYNWTASTGQFVYYLS